MTRHFLGLYLLIVLTLAVVSWAQDRALELYSSPSEATEDKAVRVAAAVLAERLRAVPPAQWRSSVSDLARQSGVDMELFATADISGGHILQKLARGETAYLQGSNGRIWFMRRIDAANVLAIQSAPTAPRSAFEWLLTLLFYAAIALVLMLWIWPLARDLRTLERAAARFGDRNWRFEVGIKPHSQIYPLAQTFRRMAERIDRLIGSHKDMSNAVSHEIKTPLSRMQFEIELAQHARTVADVERSLSNIKADIAAIDGLVRATLEYAILDRADVALNIGSHDFMDLIPAITDYVRLDARPEVLIRTQVQEDARQVLCDLHLMESVLKNLLYNAVRYAKCEVAVTFHRHPQHYELIVEDDGPGIPEPDRERVFDSFVQLERDTSLKKGYGLGLAIVKRAMEWHHGDVSITRSTLGGARICATWPSPRVSATTHRA